MKVLSALFNNLAHNGRYFYCRKYLMYNFACSVHGESICHNLSNLITSCQYKLNIENTWSLCEKHTHSYILYGLWIFIMSEVAFHRLSHVPIKSFYDDCRIVETILGLCTVLGGVVVKLKVICEMFKRLSMIAKQGHPLSAPALITNTYPYIHITSLRK